MDRINVKSGEWVVVCDGRKALVLENIGDAKYPNLHTREVHEHSETRTSEQGTDRPGKTHASVGSARSAMEQTDWHDQSERAFLTALASRLHVALIKGETHGVDDRRVPASPWHDPRGLFFRRAQGHPWRAGKGSRERSGS